MLTIRPVIETKSLSPICNTNDPLSERIRSEYDVMRAEFTPEELLHLVTEPSDIFLQEGSITTIVNDTRVLNDNRVKMDVINNLMNRLVLYNEGTLSYRDTVYVENVLRRIGITDVSNFMKQVQNLETEQLQTNELVNVYIENVNRLRNVVDAASGPEYEHPAVKGEEAQKAAKPVYYMHNDIYRRLDTANVYHELSLIHASLPGKEDIVEEAQMAMAEQNKAAKRILLNSLQNYVRKESNPVTLRTYNTYEEGDRLSSNSTKKDVVENMISAVLLSYTDKAFSQYLQSSPLYKENWYDFTRTFYNSAENTFKRIEDNHTSPVTNFVNGTDYQREIINAADRELRVVSELVYRAAELQIPEEGSEELIEKTLEVIRNYREIVNTSAGIEKRTVEREIQTGRAPLLINREGDAFITKEGERLSIEEVRDLIDASMTIEETRNYMISHPTEFITEERTIEGTERQMSTLELTNLETKTDITHEAEISSLSEIIKETRSEVERIGEERAGDRETREAEASKQRVLDERTREIINRYKNTENRFSERNRSVVNVTQNAAPVNIEVTENVQPAAQLTPEEREARNAEQMKRALDIINNQNLERLREVSREKDVLVRERQTLTFDAERARRDITKAFQDPKALELELRRDIESTQAAEKVYNTKVENVMSEETKEIFRLVSEMKNSPNSMIAEGLARPTTPDRLGPELEMINRAIEAPVANEVRETVRTETERVIREKVPVDRIASEDRRYRFEQRKNIDLIHKLNEQVTDNEELIEELKRQNSEIKKIQETNRTEIVNRTNKVVEVKNETNVNEEQINKSNIRQYIQTGVRESMDDISNQIFQRLEKKLESDRKRRGF